MGSYLTCLPHRFFDNDEDRPTSEGGSASRWQRCCHHFFCFPSCCGMYDALSQMSEEQDAHSGPLLQQQTGLLDEISAPSSVPIPPHSSYADTRHVGTLSNLLRHDKMGTNLVQTQIGETHYRNSSGSGRPGQQALVIDRGKVDDYNGDLKLKDNARKLPPSSKNGKSDAVTSLLDDDDICPTCLDGYDGENPKIITKCGHQFHLACILEWMERSSSCPLCDQEMIFDESP